MHEMQIYQLAGFLSYDSAHNEMAVSQVLQYVQSPIFCEIVEIWQFGEFPGAIGVAPSWLLNMSEHWRE